MKKNLVALMACLLTAASLGSCDNQPTETQKEDSVKFYYFKNTI